MSTVSGALFYFVKNVLRLFILQNVYLSVLYPHLNFFDSISGEKKNIDS